MKETNDVPVSVSYLPGDGKAAEKQVASTVNRGFRTDQRQPTLAADGARFHNEPLSMNRFDAEPGDRGTLSSR